MSRGYVDLRNPVSDHPANAGLAGWWLPLTSNQGGPKLVDLKSRNNGAFVGTNPPRWSPGVSQSAGALTYGGNYTNLGGLLGFAAITYSAWIYATSFANAYNGVVDRNNNAGDYTELYVKSNGKLALYTTPSFYDGTGAFTVPTNTWTHVALTYDATFGLTGYVNGQVDGTAAFGGNLGTSTSVLTSIGAAPAVGGRDFNGAITDVRIYSQAVPRPVVLELYRQGRMGNPDLLRRFNRNAYADFTTTPPAGGQYFDPYTTRVNGIVTCGVF